jgi:hypothetical protein
MVGTNMTPPTTFAGFLQSNWFFVFIPAMLAERTVFFFTNYLPIIWGLPDHGAFI